MKDNKAVYVKKRNINENIARENNCLYVNNVIRERDPIYHNLRYDKTHEVGTQYNSKRDNLICTCRTSAIKKRQDIKYFGVPKQVYAYQERPRSFTDIGIGTIRSHCRKKFKHVQSAETDDRGCGSSDLPSYIVRKPKEIQPKEYYESKQTTSKCVGGVFEYNTVGVLSEKLSPIVQTASGSTSPWEFQNKDIKIGSNTITMSLVDTTTQVEENKIIIQSIELTKPFGHNLQKSYEGKSKITFTTNPQSSANSSAFKKKYRTADKFSSDSLVEHIHDLENPVGDKQSQEDPMENKLEREYRKIFASKSKGTNKSSTDNGFPDYKSASVWQRFEALRRGLVKKDEMSKNSDFINKPSKVHMSTAGHRDVSINSDPPSLEARSFSHTKIYSPHAYQSIVEHDKLLSYAPQSGYDKPADSISWPKTEEEEESQGVKGMFKLWGKKFNFEDDHYRPNATPKSSYIFKKGIKKDDKGITKKRSLKIVSKPNTDDKEKRKFFFFKKKIKEKPFKNKKGVTTGRCEVKDGLMIKVGGNLEPSKNVRVNEKKKYYSDAYGETIQATWLQKYLSQGIESQNSIKIRWNNKRYASSTTASELIYDTVYKDCDYRSKSEVTIESSSYKSYTKHHQVNFVHQNIQAWMIPDTVMDHPKNLPFQKIRKPHNPQTMEVTISDQKWFIDKTKAFSHKIEVVLLSKNIVRCNKRKSSDYLKINIPKGFFVESSDVSDGSFNYKDKGYLNKRSHSSDEEVYKIVEYETCSDLKKDVTMRKLDDAHHKTNNIKLTVSVKSQKDIKPRVLETMINTPPTHRDDDTKRCDVIGVGIITRRDMCSNEFIKPVLKIEDYGSDDESEYNRKPSKKSRLAESYLQEYYRLGLDFEPQSDGTRSCPTILDDYQTIISSCTASSRYVCQDYDSEPKVLGPRCYQVLRKQCANDVKEPEPRLDVNSTKRIYPKDSIAVCRKRKMYAQSNKSKWGDAPECGATISSVPSTECKGAGPASNTKGIKPCWRPTDCRTKKNPDCKRVSLPNCEQINSLQEKMHSNDPESIMSFKGSGKTCVNKEAKVNPIPSCEMHPIPCQASCGELLKLPCFNSKISCEELLKRNSTCCSGQKSYSNSTENCQVCTPPPKDTSPCGSCNPPLPVPPACSPTPSKRTPCSKNPSPSSSPPPDSNPSCCKKPSPSSLPPPSSSPPCKDPLPPSSSPPCKDPLHPSCTPPSKKPSPPCKQSSTSGSSSSSSGSHKRRGRLKLQKHARHKCTPPPCPHSHPPCVASPPCSYAISPCATSCRGCPYTLPCTHTPIPCPSPPPQKCPSTSSTCPVKSSTCKLPPCCNPPSSHVPSNQKIPPCLKPVCSSSPLSCPHLPPCHPLKCPNPPSSSARGPSVCPLGPPACKTKSGLKIIFAKIKSPSTPAPCKPPPCKTPSPCKSPVCISSKTCHTTHSRTVSPMSQTFSVTSTGLSYTSLHDAPFRYSRIHPCSPGHGCDQENPPSPEMSCQTIPPSPPTTTTCEKSCPNHPPQPPCQKKIYCPPLKVPPTPPSSQSPKPTTLPFTPYNKSKITGVHLKLKPNTSKRKCVSDCALAPAPCPPEEACLNFISDDGIIIRVKKETPSTEEIREALDIRVQDDDGVILYERKDCRKPQKPPVSQTSLSLLGDLYRHSHVHRVAAPLPGKSDFHKDDKKEISENRSDTSIANTIEIQFNLKVTQGDKTTEINMENDINANGHIKDESTKPQDVFVLNNDGDVCCEKSNGKNDINIRIVIKNFKPKGNKKLSQCNEYGNEFSKQISTKFHSVSTAPEDTERTFSVHRTTVDLTSSVPKVGSKHHSEDIMSTQTENEPKNETTTVPRNEQSVCHCVIEERMSGYETENREIRSSSSKASYYDSQPIETQDEADVEKCETVGGKTETGFKATENQDSDIETLNATKSNKVLVTDTVDPEYDDDQNEDSLNLIAIPHTIDEKKKMLKRVFQKADELNDTKFVTKKLRDMFKAVMTSDKRDPDAKLQSRNDLADDITYTSLKPNYFRDTDSLNNYFGAESHVFSEKDICRPSRNSSGGINCEYIKSISSADTSEAPMSQGGCMCTTVAERLKMVSRMCNVRENCCCNSNKPKNVKSEEICCELKKDNDYYEYEAEYVNVETQNSRHLTSKVTSANFSLNNVSGSIKIRPIINIENNVSEDTRAQIAKSIDKEMPRFSRSYSPQLNQIRRLNKNTILSISDEDKTVMLTDNTRVNKEGSNSKRDIISTGEASDVLQSYETKKAVLEIYTENTASSEGKSLVAKLPKFVYDTENDIYNAITGNGTSSKPICKRNIVMMTINR